MTLQNKKESKRQGGDKMYSSIDTVDIIVRSKDKKKIMCVQTDHRTAKEMKETPDHTVVFAIMRTSVAKGVLEHNYPGVKGEIWFDSREKPWQKKIDIVTNMGAIVKVNEKNIKGKKIDVEKELNKSMKKIANDYAKKNKLKFTIKDIEKAEKKLVEKIPEGSIEEAHAIVDLAAFAGEVMKKEIGGRWIATNITLGSIAYFAEIKDKKAKGDGQYTSLTGKVRKLITNGLEDSVAYLVNVAIKRSKGEYEFQEEKEEMSKNSEKEPVENEEPRKDLKKPKKKGFFKTLFAK